MSAPFAGANVEIRTKANLDDLRKAIKEFQDGTIKLAELKKVTKDVKDATDDYSRAISTANRAQRLQNFELQNTIRVVRTFRTLFHGLNQVYQTFILRQIEANQRNIEQQRRFGELSKLVTNFGDNLENLGFGSIDVQNQFDAIISSVDNLTTKQLLDLRSRLIEIRHTTKDLTDQDIKKLTDGIKELDDAIGQSEIKDGAKQFEEFFGTFTGVSTIASDIGIFALGLSKYRKELALLLPVLQKFNHPAILALLALFFGENFVQTAGDKNLRELNKEPTPSNIGNVNDFFSRLGPPSKEIQEINIHIDEAKIDTPEDLLSFARKIIELTEEKNNRRRR